ncbi:MAG: response regulator transcription factor [Methylophilus sp.]|nr:response regulator transcription factor [Methylophilus sp.]
MHILLVEDDIELGNALQKVLKAEQLTSEWVRTASSAESFIQQCMFDCVLLDLSLPDGSGIELLKCWRKSGVVLPIIIITAQSSLEARLAGLDNGADDFVLKPFIPSELIARLHAVVRRYVRQAHSTWKLGNIEIESRTHTVKLNGQPIELSPREFAMLEELARNAGVVVSKDKLAIRLAPLGEPVEFSTLEVHVYNLRRKIGADLIKTVRGIGYMLNTNSL